MLNKKAIGPVVATALLLVVAVISVVSFGSWFNTFSSSTFVDVEQKSEIGTSLEIETLVGNTLYVDSPSDNFAVKRIEVGGVNCNININLSKGMNNISIESCLDLVETSTASIVLTSDKGVIEKQVFLEEVSITPVISLDTTPNPFNFSDHSEYGCSFEYITPEVTIDGFDGPLLFSIAPSVYLTEISVNGGSWIENSTNINPGDSISIRLTSSGVENGVDVTINLGDYTTLFEVTLSCA